MIHHLITREIAKRVMSGETKFSDPCVICGVTFTSEECPHTVHDTEDVIKRVRRMTQSQREKLK